MTVPDDIACVELVELVTEYLADALSHPVRARFEAHVRTCPGCGAHLDQMHRTIHLLGRIPAETLPPEAQASLLRAFRGWHSADSRT